MSLLSYYMTLPTFSVAYPVSLGVSVVNTVSLHYRSIDNCLYWLNLETAAGANVSKFNLTTGVYTNAVFSLASAVRLSYLPETDEFVLTLNASGTPLRVYDGAFTFKRSFGAVDWIGQCVYSEGMYFAATFNHAGRVYDSAGTLIRQYPLGQLQTGWTVTKHNGKVYFIGRDKVDNIQALLYEVDPLNLPVNGAILTEKPTPLANFWPHPVQGSFSQNGYLVTAKRDYATGQKAIKVFTPDLTTLQTEFNEVDTQAVCVVGQDVYTLTRTTGILNKTTLAYL